MEKVHDTIADLERIVQQAAVMAAQNTSPLTDEILAEAFERFIRQLFDLFQEHALLIIADLILITLLNQKELAVNGKILFVGAF